MKLEVRGGSFGYPGGPPLLRGVSFQVEGGEVLSILGPNGAGKTTLLRTLAGEMAPLAGECRLSPQAKLGFLRQGFEQLDEGRTVLENALEGALQPPTMVRTVLGRLLFRGEAVNKPLAVLSGGERMKVALCKLLVGGCNLLFLDEPTNYLDLPAVEALQSLLQGYTGTLLLVSHDEAFVEGVADRLLYIGGGGLTAFAGGLAAVFLSLGLAAAAPGRSKMNLVLAGIAVHALAQTLLMLLKLTADPEKELASSEYWIMGSLAGVTQSRVWFPVPMVISCCAVIFALNRQAMLLSVEEDEARLLGVPVGRMRFLLLTLATLVVAAVVSVTGLISFVGLLAPHCARLLAGHNRRSTSLLSGLVGSTLLLAADTIAKTVAATELPVSIFTSLLGVPFLLYLIIKPGRETR